MEVPMETLLTRSITVDIADLAVSNEPGCRLVTYSLGSCIGLAIWDPVAKVGGLLHYMLPESTIAPDKAQKQPSMFADTGIPLLFKSAYNLGAEKKRLVVKAAGAAQVMDANGVFNIGKRNQLAMRKILWRNNVMIDKEDTGGVEGRTMRLDINTGVVTIKTKNGEYEL
jgi:chemotaxis protein CheD